MKGMTDMGNAKNSSVKSGVKYTTEEESEIYKAAVQHINMHVFVYDVPLRKIYFFSSNTFPFDALKEAEYSVEDIKESGIIDSDYTVAFEKLFEGIHEGEKSTEAIIKTYYEGKVTWNHIMLVNYFDDHQKPYRVIGTIQDVSDRIEIENRFFKEQQFRLAMMADSRRVYEINVTRDRFIKLESIQDSTDYDGWELYSESMANLCKTRIYKEDWETFLKVAIKENLIQGFNNSITEFYCEYRIIDEEGKISWSSSATHLLRDPVSKDIKGFIYVKDIDEQKKREIELYQQAERDSLTGIYNRRSAERLVTQRILSSTESQIHGFMTLDIDEFKSVNDTFGHVVGDYLLQKIASGMGGILRNIDILARMGGDEFVIFIDDAGSTSHILNIANRLCGYVRNICIQEGNDMRATISIGIAIFPEHGSTFAELYKNSDKALYEVKQHGKNNVSFYLPPEGNKRDEI